MLRIGEACRPDGKGIKLSTATRSGRDIAPTTLASPAAAGLGDTLALILEALDDAKAEAVTVIDLAGKTSLADHMVIATGRSNRHVGAVAEQILEALAAAGRKGMRVEGMPHCDWVLIDEGDIVVHVFRPEVREFYNLEKMWSAQRPAERTAS